ncbi:MAG: type I restriction endonuclease subunit M [Limisphaerales bacterium]
MTQPTNREAIIVSRPTLFNLGCVVATPGALAVCAQDYLQSCLNRHVSGDFGVICDDDKQANTEAVAAGDRILSAYPINSALPCKGYGENCLWIITEGDRSVTTFLLPSEY